METQQTATPNDVPTNDATAPNDAATPSDTTEATTTNRRRRSTTSEGTTSVKKVYLTPKEAVQAGYFSSEKTAANMRSEKIGPTYHKPNNTGGRVLYAIEDLEFWVRSGLVLTRDTVPHHQRSRKA